MDMILSVACYLLDFLLLGSRQVHSVVCANRDTPVMHTRMVRASSPTTAISSVRNMLLVSGAAESF